MVHQPFPTDWRTALVLVPHPDDTEYGCAAAVAKWTSQGKHVHYALACRGEVGIPGIPPEECGPLREREQRTSSAIVGVEDVEFWDFPDSQIFNTPELRAKIAETITELAPDVVITLYSGPEWAPGAPNQRDHIEFSNAVAAAYDSLPNKPRWFFENGPHGTHGETVDDFIDVAVARWPPTTSTCRCTTPTCRSRSRPGSRSTGRRCRRCPDSRATARWSSS